MIAEQLKQLCAVDAQCEHISLTVGISEASYIIGVGAKGGDDRAGFGIIIISDPPITGWFLNSKPLAPDIKKEVDFVLQELEKIDG